MDCELLHEHCEAFALGVLEGPEAEEIRAHLERNCTVCTPAVEQAQAPAAQLAYLAPEAEPPARIRNRLLAEVTPSQTAPRRGFNWAAGLAWGIAAVLLVAAFMFRRQSDELRSRIAELEQRYHELANENEILQQVLNVVSAPETRAVSLENPASPQLHAYWHDDLGLVLAGSNMPSPPADRTYQLWVVPAEGNPVSVDIFRPTESGGVLLIASPAVDIPDSAALAVSEEPAGGSPQPTTQPTWVGPLG